MKKNIIILFLLLTASNSYGAESLCSKLFSIPTQNDSPIPKTDEPLTDFYYELNFLQASLYNLKKELALNLNTPKARRLKEEIDVIEKQIKQNNIEITKTISELLKEKNINHTIITKDVDPYKINFYIVFSREGQHYINLFTKRLFEKYGLLLSIGLPTLIENRSSVLHRILKDKNPDYSFYQDSVALREFTHYIDFNQLRQNIPKPYHARIETKIAPPDLINRLGMHSKEFSVDEIKAYRTSLRALVHEAITGQLPLDAHFAHIERAVALEVTLSSIVKNVFKKYQELELKNSSFLDKLLKRTKPKSEKFETTKIYVSPKEGYYVTARADMISETIKMSEFTHNLYSSIHQRLMDIENKSPDEKIRVLRQIAKVLSIPSVKKLSGNYPPMAEIEKILE